MRTMLTFLARVQHSIEEEWENCPKRQLISVLAIRDRVGCEMEGDGELAEAQRAACHQEGYKH